MLQRFYKANRELINKILFITVFFLFIYIFVNYIFGYIAPFIIGYVFSLILLPITNLLNKRFKIPRGLSTILLIVVILVSIVVLGGKGLTVLGDEVVSLSQNYTQYIDQFMETINEIMKNYRDFITFIPDEFSDIIEKAVSSALSSIASTLSNVVKVGSVGVVKVVPNILMSTFLSIISAYFFTKDRELIRGTVRRISPVWLSDGYKTIKDALIGAIWGYTKAQLTLMTITATVCVIGLTIIGFPYSFLIGLAASFIDALPVFGVGFVLWPMALFAFLAGNYSTALGVIIIYAIVVVTRQFLEPRILGKHIGLHPLLTLMSIYIGLKIFGLFGFIIGPMVLVVCKVILETNEQNPADNSSPKVENIEETSLQQ